MTNEAPRKPAPDSRDPGPDSLEPLQVGDEDEH